jgi:AGZA family xanthine/uracil permease-like MFS transporter
MIDIHSYFELDSNGTDIKTEIVAGLTTFFTIAYIIIVNPAVLSQAIDIQGYSDGEVFQMIAIVTIIASAIAMLVMGLYANRPFALAPGLGLQAFFTFTVVLGLGVPWQTALAAVFVEGILFILLTLTGLRKRIIAVFPEPVKKAVGAGIGAFLLMIGLQEIDIIVNSEATLVELGSVASLTTTPQSLFGLGAVVLILLLWARDVRAGILIGIVTSTIIGYIATLAGVVEPGEIVDETIMNEGIGAVVSSSQYDITPLAGAFIDGFSSVDPLTFLMVLLTFFFVDFFDTAGALIGLGQQGGMLDENGTLPEMDKPLLADGIGTTIGAMLGTSTLTTFIESSAGIEQGGRTGLTAVTVAALFLLMIPLTSLVNAIPTFASYSALVVIGIIMFQGAADIHWNDPVWAVPAALTIILMPLTYSIADGIAAGIISYPIVKTVTDGNKSETFDGRKVNFADQIKSVGIGPWTMAGAMIVYYTMQTSGLIL